MPTATITSKGQITIPVEVRKKLGLKSGDQINFFEDEDGQFTLQAKTGSILEMEGILQRMGVAPLGYVPGIGDMNQAVLDRASQLDRAARNKNADSGCTHTLTFDKEAAGTAGMTLVQ